MSFYLEWNWYLNGFSTHKKGLHDICNTFIDVRQKESLEGIILKSVAGGNKEDDSFVSFGGESEGAGGEDYAGEGAVCWGGFCV